MSKRKPPRHPPSHRRQPPTRPAPAAAAPPPQPAGKPPWRERAQLVAFWGFVLIPMAWGVAATVRKALLLFK